MSSKVFLLKCAVQCYAWGKLGLESEVAQLNHSSDESFVIGSNIPYAELWMGTHMKGPSVIAETGENLSQWIGKNSESLGKSVQRIFNLSDQLPFLFKVLSVKEALSIQVHPNKEEAKFLHSIKPGEYPDANHKPEIAIALTSFKALCGFRPKNEILSFLENIPELKIVVGELPTNVLKLSTNKEKDVAALKDCFTALMMCDSNVVRDQLFALGERIKNENKEELDEVSKILLQLLEQFPGDVGCFCIYFLNFVSLEPGESVFLGANIPHAYLHGDCLECMACSDNVVRAGLTPKYKDIKTLCDMLNYSFMSAEDVLFKFESHPEDPYIKIYNPPVDEFTVSKIQLPVGVEQYVISAIDGASLLIVIYGIATAFNKTLEEGNTIQLKRGSVLFISANESVDLKTTGNMLMFRAYCLI